MASIAYYIETGEGCFRPPACCWECSKPHLPCCSPCTEAPAPPPRPPAGEGSDEAALADAKKHHLSKPYVQRMAELQAAGGGAGDGGAAAAAAAGAGGEGAAAAAAAAGADEPME